MKRATFLKTVALDANVSFPIMLAPYLPKLRHLLKGMAPEVPVNPTATSHLMGARILLVHIVGPDHDLHHRLTACLIDHTCLLFVAILCGHCAGCGLMLTGSTTTATASLGAILVGSLRFHFPHHKPHEVVFGQKSTFLGPIENHAGTLSTRTP